MRSISDWPTIKRGRDCPAEGLSGAGAVFVTSLSGGGAWRVGADGTDIMSSPFSPSKRGEEEEDGK